MLRNYSNTLIQILYILDVHFIIAMFVESAEIQCRYSNVFDAQKHFTQDV